ncbi:MAG: ABC transporter permease [Desulfovibrionales bacterium]
MNLKRYTAVAFREWREMLRDRLFFFLAFLVPAILMIIFNFGLSMDVEDIPFAILDYDRSSASRQFSSTFIESRYFEFTGYLHSEQQIPKLFEENRIRAAIIIPPDFEETIAQGRRVQVQTLLDGIFPSRAQTVQGYVEGMLQDFSRLEARKFLLTGGMSPNRAQTLAQPVEPQVRYMFNQRLESNLSMAPKMIMFVLMIASPLLSAVGIVREKESGAIANIYASTITPLEYLLGKITPYVAVSALNSVVLWALAVLLFGAPFKGNPFLFFAACMIYVVCTTGIGLIVSVLVRTQVAAVLVTFVVTTMPTVIYSGVFVPLDSMDRGAQAVAYMLPAIHFTTIVVGTFLKGVGFSVLWDNFLVLGLYAIGLFGIGWLKFTKRPTR